MTDATKDRPREDDGDRPEERAVEGARRPYAPPKLERLGTWRALTLQQSFPITNSVFPFLGFRR